MNRAFRSSVFIQGQVTRSLSSITNDYQFIQKSRLPAFHFQPSLPRLPIPTLEKSCERYLRAQRPLLDDNEYNEVAKIIAEFRDGEGSSLQKELTELDKKNSHTSYVAKPWSDMYLTDRKPLPINYNPFLVFINDPKKEYNTQLIRSTNLVISSLRFFKSLRANLIEPEVYHLNAAKSDTKLFRTVTRALPSSISWYGAYLFKAFPLDMSQYKNLFSTCRIPQQGMDTLFHDDNTRHITVMRGGKFFKLRVLDESGNIIDAGTLYTCMKYILHGKSPEEAYPVGVLTTENRDVWAMARNHLESIGNTDALKEIEGAIFNLVLDDFGYPETDYPNIIKQYLHSNGKNRYFDKSFSLIVDRSGIAGVNFEHAWGDGIAVLRYFQDIYKDSVENPQVHPDSATNSCQVEDYVSNINFLLDDKSKASIEKAARNFEKTTSSLGIAVHEFQGFGRNLCKKWKISPDFLMQLSFQMAHHKLANRFVSTYESCSTAAFKHGRTETMRPLTVEAKDLCVKFASTTETSSDSIIGLMKSASEIHGTLIKEAAMGQGFDRHLFVLKLLSEKTGRLPLVFAHPSYKRLNHYILSTSTLTSEVVMLGAFGPVVPDGYGIGYTILNERLGAIVSNYKENTDGNSFISCWQSSLNRLHKVLN